MSQRIQAQAIVHKLSLELWAGSNGYAYKKLIRVSAVSTS